MEGCPQGKNGHWRFPAQRKPNNIGPSVLAQGLLIKRDMTQNKRWMIVAGVLATLLVVSLPVTSQASARDRRTLVTQKKGNRLVRKARVALRRLVRPLKRQKAPIKLNWTPKSAQDFNIVPLVKSFQAKVPAKVQKKMARASSKKLANAHSVSYTQKVNDQLGKSRGRAAVHITRGTVNVPLNTFLKRLPAEQWGVKLDHYLGGEVKVTKRDAKGAPVQQVERMVLSGLPGNINMRGLNLDMSKVEQKEIIKDRNGNVSKVTMFWRVHDSANKTTIMDVGSVSFQANGNNQTMVTFHSAHQLGKGRIKFPNALVKPTLRGFFSDHIRHYRKLVTE